MKKKNDKKFKVDPLLDNDKQVAWAVIRVGHPSKGDYIFATFYDRGAIQMFTEALERRGFVNVSE